MMTTHRIPSRPLCSAPPSKVPGRAAALISSAWNPQILIGVLDSRQGVMLVTGSTPDTKPQYKVKHETKFIWSGNSTKVCLWLPICWFGIWKNNEKYGPSEYWTPTATTLCMHWLLSLVPFGGHHGTFYVHMRSAGGTLKFQAPALPRQKPFVTKRNVGLDIPKCRVFLLKGSRCLAN